MRVYVKPFPVTVCINHVAKLELYIYQTYSKRMCLIFSLFKRYNKNTNIALQSTTASARQPNYISDGSKTQRAMFNTLVFLALKHRGTYLNMDRNTCYVLLCCRTKQQNTSKATLG